MTERIKGLDELLGTGPQMGCREAAPGRLKRDLLRGAAQGALGHGGRAGVEAALTSSPTSPFARTEEKFGYLAATAQEVLLVATRPAFFGGHKAVEVLARAPRRELSRIDLGEGRLGHPMTVWFADGSSWEIEVPTTKAREARAFIAAL